ncbi:MAG: hypothetical protein NT051_02720 [Candidatus Micrarchaeota archaeon]|nr:hypothetical protein [Candidatus Micrarchaeota archaeon]
MNRRHLLIFSIFALALVGMAHAIDIDTSPCADGTAYGKCSKNPPGFLCTGSPGAHALVPDTTHAICKCSDVSGYIESGEECVLAKCGSIDAGACDTANKPKMCMQGALINNATKCGCPTGMLKNSDSLTCAYPPCNDSGTMVTNSICSPKTSGKKCVNGALVDSASTCPCKVGMTKIGEICTVLCEDSTKSGECSTAKPKKCMLTGTGTGYLTDAADECGCPTGKNVDGKHCADSVLGALGSGADILGGSAPSDNSSASGTSGTSPFSCCCLPAALVGIVGGFAFSRKK